MNGQEIKLGSGNAEKVAEEWTKDLVSITATGLLSGVLSMY